MYGLYIGQILQGFVAVMVSRPTPDRLTDVSAFALPAGRKPANGRPPFPSAFLARNMNPRKANDWFRKSPRRFASLQYTTFVFCGCSTNLQAAKRSASALHSACASSALLQ